MKALSIIIPIYNEAASLPDLLARLNVMASDVEAEFSITLSYIFIDDGSADDSFARLVAHDFAPRSVRLLKLSRNFGKEAALSAGIDEAVASGTDAAVLMDADLQHPPEMVADFVRIWLNQGVDSVYAYKTGRLHSDPYVPAALQNIDVALMWFADARKPRVSASLKALIFF